LHGSSAVDERIGGLLAELDAAREEVSVALAAADPTLLTVPGLIGEWSAREVVAHLAHWDDWGSTCLEAVTEGRLQELASDTWDVDAQNAEVAAGVASRPMSAVRDREADAYQRFADRLARLDPSLLDVRAPWGGTVETIVRENGPDHYAEHAAELRAWFSDGDAADTDDDAEER
jgi:hypothetical protein